MLQMFFYCKLSILFTSLTHITFTVRCCNVMQSCLTVTRGQLHAQTMTRQFFGVQIGDKVSSDLPKRERSPYSELKDRCFTSLQNIVHDFIQNLNTSTYTCSIRRLKRNFSRLCKLRKRSSDCTPRCLLGV